MKKIICVLMALVSLVSLTGCSNKIDYTLDDTAKNTEIAKEWLNDVEYSVTAYNSFDDTKAHYRAYLPTNMKNSLRLNVLDMTSQFTSSLNKFVISYASCASVADTFKATFVNEIKGTDVNSVLAGSKMAESWDSDLIPAEEFITNSDNKSISCYVVYLPVRIESYLLKDKVTVKVLNSYVICPIVYGLAFSDGGALQGVSDTITGLSTVTISYSGVLK